MTRPFRYYLLRSDGRALQIVNDVVTSLNNKQALTFTPDGWQDIIISWERDAAKYGIQRNFTLPIQFVRDGARICRHVAYNENFDAQIFLLIQKLNLTLTDTTFQWIYDYFYRGEIDWTTFTDDDPKVSVSIMEGGLTKLLKANESTQYSIPFDEDAKNIRMDGLKFFEKANYVNPELEVPHGIGFHFLPMTFLNDETNNPNIAFFSQQYSDQGGGPDLYKNSLNYFLICNVPTTIRIVGSISFDMRDNDSYLLQIVGATAGDNGSPHFSSPLITAPGVQTIDIDETISLVQGEKLFITALKGDNSILYKETNLQITFDFKFQETIIKAFDPLTMYRKLVEKITGFADDASSSLLQNCSYYITSGDAIRGLEGAAIKTSLADFFKAYNVYLMAGIAIENNKIAIEARSHYFDSSTPIELGNAKGLKISAAADMLGSSIKIGHAEQNIDDVNGKFDFNGYHIYTTPQTRVSRQIDLQSPYKAGPYEIEIIRINLDGKTTTDNDNDNDVYVLDINTGSAVTSVVATVSFVATINLMIMPVGIDIAVGQRIRITGSASNDGDYKVLGFAETFVGTFVALDGTLTDESNVSVQIEWLSGLVYDLDRSIVPDDPTFDTDGNILTGFPDKDTIFNVRLSPKRLLLVHQQWLRSTLYNYEPGMIKFETANRYASFTAGGIKENDDLQIASMGERMFYPFKFEFEDQVPVELINLMEANPNRCFSFIWNGITYKGFNLKVNQAANTESSQSFLLLSTPDNDPSTLVTE